MPQLSFGQRIQSNAILLRGAYLDLCCDLEFLLVDITCVCLVYDKQERDNVRDVLMEQNLMSKKITMAEYALQKYNMEYYNKYTENFAKFRELTGWRNKFAHSRIKGDEAELDTSYVIFEYIKEGKMIEKKEEYLPLKNKLNDYATYLHNMVVHLIPVLYYERSSKS